MSLYSTPIKNPSYFDRIGYQAGLLSGICCLVAVLILSGNQSTREKIENVVRQDQLKMLEQVLPSSLYNNNLLEEAISVNELQQQFGSDTLYIAKQDDQVVGYAFMVAKEGYSGQIKLIMGLDDSGTILGVRVISHTETPGLGDKIELAKSDWIKSFNHKSLTNTSRSNWAVKKDGGQFDQFTGATITPRAVVKAIVSGLDFYTNTLATPAATDNVNQPAKQPTKTTETLTLNKGSTRDE